MKTTTSQNKHVILRYVLFPMCYLNLNVLWIFGIIERLPFFSVVVHHKICPSFGKHWHVTFYNVHHSLKLCSQ